ncbi:Hypothetical predicted protein [Octopus vulgaris]|uniref:Uncharacterized protein n=1 Tax=Octopus vulgaris TaxID=6645 RepID=A0AA36C1E3_OCTVU|nr:Hypothetical predicted protein [Octopus vulgaris]
MVSDDMKRISDSRGSPHDPQGTRNKLIMTNIYADKMRFGNKGNKCDVVGFVNGNHVNKVNNENCNDENTMDDNSNGREDVANNRSHTCELRFKVGHTSSEGRIGMTNNANCRDNHNNDVGDDIIDYNDYQGGNNSVNCTDNGNTNISKNKNKNKNDVLNLNIPAS